MRALAELPGAYRLTYQDWLQTPDHGWLYEIVEGELVVSPPPAIRHQRVSRRIGFLLFTYLQERDLGEMLHAPVGVRLADDTVLEPDLIVVRPENAPRIAEHAIEGPPDLVVEILSPGTASRDLGRKRVLYEAHGVPEYWIVDPESRSVEVLALSAGRYARHGLFRMGTTLRSATFPDFALPLDGVFAEP